MNMLQGIWRWIVHWIIFGVVGIVIIFLFIAPFNPLFWILLPVYFLIQPSYFEIDLWSHIRRMFFGNKPVNWLQGDYLKSFGGEIVEDTGKRAEEKPEKRAEGASPAIFAFYPHGLHSISRIIHTCCHESPIFKHIYSSSDVGVLHCVHSTLFAVPFLREFLLLNGFIPVSKHYIEHYIQQGYNITITPGGIKEILYAKTGANDTRLYMKKHRGIYRISEKFGIPITPVYSYGEQQLFTYNYRCDWLNKLMGHLTGYSFCFEIFQGWLPHNLLKWFSLFLYPQRMTMTGLALGGGRGESREKFNSRGSEGGAGFLRRGYYCFFNEHACQI